MRLYLDDDSASLLLIRLLRQAGHDAQRPSEAGSSGEDDPVHLAHAARQDRVLLSHNYHDFENLHDLVVAVNGRHPGVLVVRKDNDPRRDLTERGIVRAIGKLLAAGVAIANEYIVLNHWR
jgi:predicted nuclease of predicted toxin-antitoxin system